MRSPEPRTLAGAILLAALGSFLFLCVREAGLRSLVPLELDGVVGTTSIETEKHPGVDDSYFVSVDGSVPLGRRRVDRPIHDAVAPGAAVKKRAGETSLEVDGNRLPLVPSSDRVGFGRVAPLVTGGAFVLMVLSRRRG